ncbi:hypothetical protein GCM10007203_15190 [Staphylococcus nepalensis]|jgi:hypothetical protein
MECETGYDFRKKLNCKLTQEEIDLIGTHLDKEIEDLNHYIEHEKSTRLRKQTRQKRTEIKRYKKKFAA